MTLFNLITSGVIWQAHMYVYVFITLIGLAMLFTQFKIIKHYKITLYTLLFASIATYGVFKSYQSYNIVKTHERATR